MLCPPAIELGPDNIRFNSLLPGIVADERQQRVLVGYVVYLFPRAAAQQASGILQSIEAPSPRETPRDLVNDCRIRRARRVA